jgi:hypothetical protein
MMSGIGRDPQTVIPLFSVLLAAGGGCATTDVAVRPVFGTYGKVSVWPRFGGPDPGGLERSHEELFLPLYMAAFPRQALVERRDLEAVIGEQDILPDRLDEESRAKIRRILGVEAIVFPNYTGGSAPQLAIKVIDTETGVIAAALVVQERANQASRPTRDPVPRLIRRAIRDLRRASEKAGSESSRSGASGR